MASDNSSQWWRPRTLRCGHRLRTSVGPLRLEIYHGPAEWQLAWDNLSEGDTAVEEDEELATGPLEREKFERFVFRKTTGHLRLKPLLLDRPLVARPIQPIFLPGGESTTLYLSSPVCLSVEVEQPPLCLREIPTLRLSDTWFGPSTREGELCYAGLTHARASPRELPRRMHRAMTPVQISNRSSTLLPLEKLSLPVPALSLYGAEDGTLWTQSLSLTRTSDTDLAAVEFKVQPPPEAGRAEKIGGPRVDVQRGGLVRAFSLFFGD